MSVADAPVLAPHLASPRPCLQFMASILSLVHPTGRVHTIDPWGSRFDRSWQSMGAPARRLFDQHVVRHVNSSVSEGVVRAVREAARASRVVMVILDSNHERSHVAQELALFAPLVTPGSYLIVEDTKMDRMMLGADDERDATSWHGPAAATAAFLAAKGNAHRFVVDRSIEKLWYTQHTRGFLRRRHTNGAPAA